MLFLANLFFATALITAQVPSNDDLPIFDTHLHYNREAWGLYSVDEVLALLDQAGVRKAFVSSTPDEGTLMLYDRAPERIVPSLRPYRTPVEQFIYARDPTIVSYVQERLAERRYRGIGEFHLLPGDAWQPAPIAFAALGGGSAVILHVHGNAVALQQFLDLRSDDTVLWAHAGMSESPATVQRVLESYPNVWVDLALRYDVAPDGRLDPAWAALFQRYPDRFMIGTDTWIPSQWTRLPALMAAVRTWLRQLPPEVATAIAYTNADRLLAAQ
jgi:hypothetical protein